MVRGGGRVGGWGRKAGGHRDCGQLDGETDPAGLEPRKQIILQIVAPCHFFLLLLFCFQANLDELKRQMELWESFLCPSQNLSPGASKR